MAVNEEGFVRLFNMQYAPSQITAVAKEAISDGEFVFCSGATGVVNGGTDSYTVSDIEVATNASGANVIGMALGDADSGSKVTIATRGAVIVRVGTSIDASQAAGVDGSHGVAPAGGYDEVVGRTLTAGASGGYCIVGMNLV